MKREARLLLKKAIDSLILSIDHFNCCQDTGRAEAVLILLDHSFEMLLKASIVERGGDITDKDQPSQKIGFDKCLRIGLDGGDVQFLAEEQVLALQALNGQRDAAQHFLTEVSEHLLYVMAQTGLTLFREILLKVFEIDLCEYLPARVLPVSTIAPTHISAMFENEIEEVRRLFQPGKRRRTEGRARLRSLAILNNALEGRENQPSERELGRIGSALAAGHSWEEVFPGVAAIEFTTTGYGPALEIHWTQKEGVPIQAVPEGTAGASVVAVRRVNELDFYNLSLTNLRQKVGLTQPKCLAVIWFSDLQFDPDCFKTIRIEKTEHKRYSQKAIQRIRQVIEDHDLDEMWEEYKRRPSPTH
ncbi:DUF3644 domain-containing protein [Aggregatilinea lenta]|uniref:DUF3644 domain-containing protein n=1 Tax=Aggregatilinea lenta TaxID=913108 RepID=UPI000E5BA73D|nr:DUF3644 domain-containing protein [Aggregatilinea lenta]